MGPSRNITATPTLYLLPFATQILKKSVPAQDLTKVARFGIMAAATQPTMVESVSNGRAIVESVYSWYTVIIQQVYRRVYRVYRGYTGVYSKYTAVYRG